MILPFWNAFRNTQLNPFPCRGLTHLLFFDEWYESYMVPISLQLTSIDNRRMHMFLYRSWYCIVSWVNESFLRKIFWRVMSYICVYDYVIQESKNACWEYIHNVYEMEVAMHLQKCSNSMFNINLHVSFGTKAFFF